jgi:hypothetical protein
MGNLPSSPLTALSSQGFAVPGIIEKFGAEQGEQGMDKAATPENGALRLPPAPELLYPRIQIGMAQLTIDLLTSRACAGVEALQSRHE